jgi:competence protein ComEC
VRLRGFATKLHGRALAAGIRDLAEADLSEGRGFVFIPVLLAAGIALYFSLPFEPNLVISILAAASIVVFAVWARRIGRPHRLLIATAAIVAGFALAGARTEWVAAPRLERSGTVAAEGWIERAEPRGNGATRLTIRPYAIDRLETFELPRRLTMTVRGADAVITAGTAVAVLGRLGPPSPPLLPGSYDFARITWYDAVGGTGFSYGATRAAENPPPAPLDLRLMAALEGFRRAVAERIMTTVPGDAGAIAAALIVGERGSISDETDEAMRISGLSHILSISGVHMTLVAGAIFFAVRALLALSSTLALLYPIKKWAASAALVGIAGYLLVSGMDVPAQRSALMAGMVLVAVLIDRAGDPMRVLALAAILIFVLTPEAVLDPGAQMSFLAVAALVATFERYRQVEERRALAGKPRSGARFAMAAIGGVLLTSLVAGLATAPVAVDVFHRVSPLTIFANLAATPIVSFVIMPMAVFAAVLMPLGLDYLPLHAMGLGIEALIVIANVAADWTPGAGAVGEPHALMAPLAILGILWFSLWTTRLRLLAVVPVLAALALAPHGPRPDMIVSGEGGRVLVHGADGLPRLIGRGSAFEASIWLSALGDTRNADDISLFAGVSCDDEACVGEAYPREGGETGSPLRIAVVRDPAAFAEECRPADVVVTALRAPAWCGRSATVIDGSAALETGARTYRLDTGASEEPGAIDVNAPDRPTTLLLVDRSLPATLRPWQGAGRPQ